MTFRSIYWDDKDARLKTYSSSTKSDGRSVVKIEIEVHDTYRLASILRDLAELRAEQKAAVPLTESKKPKRPGSRRVIASQRPLLLTYQRED